MPNYIAGHYFTVSISLYMHISSLILFPFLFPYFLFVYLLLAMVSMIFHCYPPLSNQENMSLVYKWPGHASLFAFFLTHLFVILFSTVNLPPRWETMKKINKFAKEMNKQN